MTSSYEKFLAYYHSFIANDLLYQHPNTIKEITSYLRNNIIQYAINNSPIYNNYDESKIYTRKDLINKKLWVNPNFPANMIINHSTSGSTTGEPFSYHSNRKYYEWLQNNCEFDLILKEYELYNKPIKLLCLLKYPGNPRVENFSFTAHNHSKNQFHCFNAKDCTTTFVSFDKYMSEPDKWHEELLDLLSIQTFDIVLSSGPILNILTKYIKQKKFTHKFTHLLSHTTEFPRINDFKFLQTNRNIEYYCDHMRCWDGGAGFFTCKFGTYHLLDNFSWVIQREDNKLISTDYFNLASPFINYWNGDRCEIINEYQKCECGRYYRPFKMLENRPFALKGPTKLTTIKEQINQLHFKDNINQVQFEGLEVNVYVNNKIDTNGVNQIVEILKDYKVNFYD